LVSHLPEGDAEPQQSRIGDGTQGASFVPLTTVATDATLIGGGGPTFAGCHRAVAGVAASHLM
jgi:hypothetical protein